jgi:hypothetical protein
MKKFILFILFSLCILSAFADEEEATLNLGKANFEETITSNEFVLSMFYAPCYYF